MRQAALIMIIFLLISVPGWTKDAAPTPAPNMMEDLARFDQKTNAGRSKVLRTILLERRIPYQVERFSNTHWSKATRPVGSNIIVTLGSGPKDIVICAHYDAWYMRDGTLSKGMMDNGAAVTVLLRLAETLKGSALKHRVRIVFTDMEELGTLGSRNYVAKHTSDEIAAMINLDVITPGKMVAYGSTDDAKSLLLHRTAEATCSQLGVKCLGFAKFPQADERPFREAGIASVSMAVIPEVEAHQLWLTLNGGEDSGLDQDFEPKTLSLMHSERDTMDIVSAEAMSIAHDVLLGMVHRWEFL